MNIVNKLTLRHMKQNKRRTIVTVIGVIISVAMITAVATLGVSFLDLMKRQVIATSGEWHTLYKDVNKQQFQAIRDDEKTKQMILSQDKGFAKIAELGFEENRYKPYIAVRAYNEVGFEKFPLTLIQGKMPTAPNEIVLSKHFLEELKVGYSIGDEIELTLGVRYLPDEVLPDFQFRSGLSQDFSAMFNEDGLQEKLKDEESYTYKIVGVIDRPIWENAWAPGYTALTYLDEQLISDEETVNASVIVKNVNSSIWMHTSNLASELGIKNYNNNNELLRYDFVSINNGVVMTLYSLTIIIMLIVLVGSISLIYNAFGISVADRSRYLGMLASVGATRRQKRNSVFFEGFIISIISIPIGMLGGLVGLAITFWSINSMIEGVFGLSEPLLVKVLPETMLLAVVISLLTIFISTWWPAKRASNVSAIDAIRQTLDIKLSKKKVKTSKIVRKLFGIEAEIGLKNLKRNKRRYQITVFSLVISILLFLTVSYFTEEMKRSMDVSNDGYNYDIMLETHDDQAVEGFQQVFDMKNVMDYNLMEEKYVESYVDKKHFSPLMKAEVEAIPEILVDGRYPYSVYLYSMTDEALTKFAVENGIDPAPLFDENANNAILLNVNTFYSIELQKQVEEAALVNALGQELEIKITEYVEEEDDNGEVTYVDREIAAPSLHIAAVTEKFPMGIVKGNSAKGIVRAVVSNKTMESYEKAHSSYRMYMTSSDPLATQKEIQALEELNSFYMSNLYEGRRQEQQMLILISVFTYGFIALITLISMANILNTISTSIHLRKREFAMLKSMGMTSKGFNRMMNYESIFYGIKALLYGLPLSILVMYIIYRSMMNTFLYPFILPWKSLGIVIVGVFLIVGAAMLYASSKVRKDNIVDAIKQENL